MKISFITNNEALFWIDKAILNGWNIIYPELVSCEYTQYDENDNLITIEGFTRSSINHILFDKENLTAISSFPETEDAKNNYIIYNYFLYSELLNFLEN